MQLLHDYIISLVNLYGIVHKEKVIEIYNKQNDDSIDLNVMEMVIQDDAIKLEEDFAFIEGDYFVQESIFIYDELYESLAKRAGKPFYIPSKKELLKYKDEFYIEKTKQYIALLRYVQKNLTNGDKSEAVEISEDILSMCQVETSPTTIFDQLTNSGITFENERQVGKVLNLIMDLTNNSRLWVNNGFTPNELSRIVNPAMYMVDSVNRDRVQKKLQYDTTKENRTK